MRGSDCCLRGPRKDHFEMTLWLGVLLWIVTAIIGLVTSVLWLKNNPHIKVTRRFRPAVYLLYPSVMTLVMFISFDRWAWWRISILGFVLFNGSWFLIAEFLGGRADSPEEQARRVRGHARSMGQSPAVTTRQVGAAYGVQAVDDKALILIESATSARQSGNPKKALSLYKEAIGLQGDSVDAHNGLAATYLDLGSTDAAIKEYRLAIELAPDHIGDKIQVIYVNLANAFRTKGIDASAIYEFERAVRGLPKSSGYYCALGILYHEARDGRNARAALREVLKIDANGLCGKAASQLLSQIG
jgi:Flp pilus assembly protein TadD